MAAGQLLAITRRTAGAAALLGLLPLWVACPQQTPPPPNVLLISLDSTRRDLLGVYGHSSPLAPDVSSSPRLDALAADGVVMNRAYSTTSWTFPAHVSLLTGEPELVHAVDIDTHRPDPLRPFLSERLRERGYRTAGFVSGPYLEAGFGFDRGFDRYETRYGEELAAASATAAEETRALEQAERDGRDLPAARAAERRARAALDRASHQDRSARSVSDAVIEELERAADGGQPFFVFAHYFDPHYDYVPPAEEARRFDPAYAGAISGEHFYTNPAISTPDPERPGRRLRVVSDRDLSHLRALYAAELATTDAEIGRALDALEARGLAANTLVVVTADHGDEFFEHDGIGHRSTLYEELVRVPLILRLPGRLPAGARIDALVSLVDLAATVLELIDPTLAAPAGSTSFLPLIDGSEDGAGRAVFGRLATARSAKLSVAGAAGAREVIPVLALSLTESYRQGSLKITRTVHWNRPRGPVPPRTLRAIREQNRRQREGEELRWIDLARFPAEREEDHSTDFSDPAARAALRAFNERYTELLARRGHADLAVARDDELARLQALGYVEEGGERPSIASEEFTLAPPGRAILAP
jgi:arylsulfatase A-like enzyme